MTKQSEINGNDQYVAVLDHGFVGVVDHMGSDNAVVQAARVSYGAGTRSVREDRGLIRYLIRHQHWSPVEMAEVKLHIKLPIFVMRQLVRHRTASLNEESARYSVVSDEFYLPEPDVIQAQSKDNKQGRADVVDPVSQNGVRWLMDTANRHNYNIYETLLGRRATDDPEDDFAPAYDAYGTNGLSIADPMLTDEFPGVARELARAVLPVGAYTELYWKQDLRCLLHMLNLRSDPHAQYEIRMYAEAIIRLAEPLFPLCFEAFEDYVRGALTISRMERNLLRALVSKPDKSARVLLNEMVEISGGEKGFAEEQGMSLRELREFRAQWGL